jgi:rRNA maturation endonuclease Nob1
MPLTLEEIQNLSNEDRIKAYEKYYGRKIITPRGYKDENGKCFKSPNEWYEKARCICDCGANVKLRYHSTHKKSKKHKEYLDKIQSET